MADLRCFNQINPPLLVLLLHLSDLSQRHRESEREEESNDENRKRSPLGQRNSRNKQSSIGFENTRKEEWEYILDRERGKKKKIRNGEEENEKVRVWLRIWGFWGLVYSQNTRKANVTHAATFFELHVLPNRFFISFFFFFSFFRGCWLTKFMNPRPCVCFVVTASNFIKLSTFLYYYYYYYVFIFNILANFAIWIML